MVRTGTPGIYRKGNRYVVTFRDTTGRQRKRSVRTLAEARTTKAALTADVARSEYVAESRVAFADYARQWIDTYAGRTARGIRPGTVKAYRAELGLDAEGQPTGGGAVAYFGRMPLAAIRAQDVKGYAAHVAARGVARNTVRLAVAPVKALLATAFEEGLLRSNPAAGLRLGRVVAGLTVKETHALTEAEVVRVLGEIPKQHRLMVEFLVQTGLRISEALPLTKADVDFGRRRVSVTRRLSQGTLDAPKSRHGIRQVSLSPELARRLWTRLATSPDESLLFARPDGRTIDRSCLYRVVRAAGESAGIEWPVGLHTLRHSCGTLLYLRGADQEQIRKSLGHHSWSFTASTYIHLSDDDLPGGAMLADLVASDEGNTRATRPAETGRDALAVGEAV
ncbi:MAG TPA: site-specific integrase [Gaiellaceae bacterium]|nr:site-specific integrase [Gaiellaceae bacterium]